MPASSGPVQFGHVWGTVNDEDAYAIDVDSSGNLYLSGQVSGPGLQGLGSFVAKVNVLGNKMWDVVLSSPTNNLRLWDSAIGPSNCLYVVGDYWAMNGSDVGTFYAKIDSSGSLVYQKYLPGLTTPNRICANAAGGGFIIVGDRSYYGTGAVVAVKDDGSVNWALSAESPDEESPWAAVTDSSGSVYTFQDSIYDSNVAIAKFSKVGHLVKQKVLLTDTVGEYTWDLAIGRDGNIYALGADYGSGRLLLASFTPKLDLIWDEYVGTPFAGYEATRLVVASDGSLYAVGYTTYSSNGTYGPAVFRLSTSGAVLESTFFARDIIYGAFHVSDACAYPAGGVLLAGGSYGYPKTTPVGIQDVVVSDVPNDWRDDTTTWTKLSLSTVPGDIVSKKANGVMDNYDNSQGSQAWYGLMDPPPPAFKSSMTIKTTNYQYVLSFRATASGGKTPYSYTWYFGDGSSATGSNVNHEYSMGGTFHVFLVVKDGKGLVSWATADVMIPASPIITDVSYYPDPAYVGSPVYFGVSAYDPDGGVLSYLWSFGDGASLATSEPYANHTYYAQGVYDLQVTVTDDEGDAVSTMLPVTVMQYPNVAPYASFFFTPVNPYVGQDVTFDGSASYDPDGFIMAYVWTIENMSIQAGPVIHHVFSSIGTFTVYLTVYDNMGAAASHAAYVPVSQAQPPEVVLSERFDSWASLDPGWSIWNCTNPPYNYIDIRNGAMYMSDYPDVPVNDSLNAKASWSSLVAYSSSLRVSFNLYLPLASNEKIGFWGQWVMFDIFASTDNQYDTNSASITSRFLMDTWTGAVNGWSYVGSDGVSHKICDFQAGWHYVSVIMTRGSTTWTAMFDNASYPGLTYRSANQTGFDVSKLMFMNSLREEVVVAEVDDLMVVRQGAPPTPPTAAFSYYVIGSTVYVDATGSTSQAGIASYAWSWGDGSSIYTTTPYASHAYGAGNGTLASSQAQSSVVVEEVPLTVPYMVYGYVTDANGTAMKGCDVMIMNMNTWISVNMTTDLEYGYYSYDLNSMPGGWQNGDLIRVEAFSGYQSGFSEGIANTSTPYLQLDVVIQPTYPVIYYTVTLTVTDTLGQTAMAWAVIPISVY